MKAATDINLATSQLGAPLVQFGPGGTYNTSYLTRGNRLLAVNHTTAAADNPANSNSGHEGGNHYLPQPRQSASLTDGDAVAPLRRTTLVDRLLGIDRVDLSGAALAVQPILYIPCAADAVNAAHDQLNRSLSEAAGAWLSGQMAWFAGAIASIQRLLAQITVAECRHAVAASTVPSHASHTIDARTASGGAVEIIRPRPFGSASDRGRHLVTRVSTPPDRLSQFASIIAYSTHRLPVAIDLSRSHSGAEEYQDESHTQAIENSATDPRISPHTRLFADDAGTRGRTRREQGDRLRTRRIAYQKGRAEARCQQGTLFINQ